MSTDENKAIVRRFMEEIWQKSNLAAIDEYISPDYIDRSVPSETSSRATMKEYMKTNLSAFSNLRLVFEDQIAEGDKVSSLYTTYGTFTGPYMDLPPNGRDGELHSISIHRLENGKIVEAWYYNDLWDLLQRIGAIPPMG